MAYIALYIALGYDLVEHSGRYIAMRYSEDTDHQDIRSLGPKDELPAQLAALKQEWGIEEVHLYLG